MLQRLIRQGDDYLLVIEPVLIQQAGLNEHTCLDVTVAGSSIVAAPLPVPCSTDEPQPISRAEEKQAEMLRRMGE